MQRNTFFALAAILAATLGLAACSNQNGAGGTVDGTDEDNYELNQDHLAPPMDSLKAAAAQTSATTPAVVDTASRKAK